VSDAAKPRGAAPQRLRPPLKWAGGKRWLVPALQTIFECSGARRLVEPFCGGLAVSLGLSPDRALLNDINPHAINFYLQLQNGLRVRIAMRNEADLYYSHRETFNRMVQGRGTHTSKAAQLFYFLNRTGYNGLCRFNASGAFNVPFGRYRRINYLRNFDAYVGQLAAWEFRHGDFATLALQQDDFAYADPPYDQTFNQYSRQGFDFDQQQRLAIWLSVHPGPVALSNQSTRRINELYRDLGYQVHHLTAPRMISCNGDRQPAREVLALRNIPAVRAVREDGSVVLRRRRT
jgi:DNA adenine methylase